MTTPKGELRRQALITAASELLVSDGLDGVNHRAVAARAAVPLGATTYYFAGVDDLRKAAVDALVEADLARMEHVADALSARHRAARSVATVVVELLTPPGRTELVAWYERYLRSARQPLLADAARRTNAAARRLTAEVLDRSGWAGAAPAEVVLAVVDGAVLTGLVEGAGFEAIRRGARSALTFVLEPRPDRAAP